MCVQRCALAVVLLAVPMFVSATSYVVPTTTLAAQTSNNTSTASGFTSQTNGNRGPGNISKMDVHSLLYAGATTKVYAALMMWWGQSSHINIGYSSTDPAQIKRQVEDMISRGINGVIIAWYGPNNAIDQATKLLMAEAENHPGFTFAIMIDHGAILWDSCAGCTPQQALTAQMQYLEQTYFHSTAYMTEGGVPVVTDFDIDLNYAIDWNTLNTALSTHPLFLFQNNSGFSHVLSGGSYSWVMPTTTDHGASYLSSFYDTGMSFPTEQTVGATYKGFNDTLASWGSKRIMGQQCGQTWLQTFSELNGLYSAGKQLPDLQLVTWNDYEEGTEIESGIDNCVTLSGSVAGNNLQWTIGGDESTIDHYTVYISTDGQNLMALTDMAVGLRSLNLCGFPVPAGELHPLRTSHGQGEYDQPNKRRPQLQSFVRPASAAHSSSDPASDTAPTDTAKSVSQCISIIRDHSRRAIGEFDGHCEPTVRNVQQPGLALLHWPAKGMGLLVLARQHDHRLDSGEFQSHDCCRFRHSNEFTLLAKTDAALCHVAAVPGDSGVCFYGHTPRQAQAPGARHLRRDRHGNSCHFLRGG